jgi:alpha-1,6-mannosyltransferase
VTLVVVALLFGSASISIFSLYVSSHNYPGGHAFLQLHLLAERAGQHNQTHTVHIDTAAAMSGVSRFGEAYANWNYSKLENLAADDPIFETFDYLISEVPPPRRGFVVVHAQTGTRGVRFDRTQWPYVHVIIEPMIYIYARHNDNNDNE